MSPVFAVAIVGSLYFKWSRRIGVRGSQYAAIAVTIGVVACVAVNAGLGDGSPVPLTGGASFTVGTLVAAMRSWMEIRRRRTEVRLTPIRGRSGRL